jgi:hypothetical protein
MEGMKTILRILTMVGLTFLMLSLTECNPNNDRVADRDDDEVEVTIDDERNDLREELRELRNDIDRELERIGNKIDRATDADDRDRLEDANRRLTEEKLRVDESLEDLETASEETWKDVKAGARKTSQEVRQAFRELGNDIDDLFDNDEEDGK